MRRPGMYGVGHWLATVAGWYILSAAAQGAVDGSGEPSIALIVFNLIIEILAFPLVLAVIRLLPGAIGGFDVPGLLGFAAAAALNSALVVAACTGLLRAIRRYATPPD
jgi:hypothetical protein